MIIILLLFYSQEDDVARVTKEAEKNLENLRKQVSLKKLSMEFAAILLTTPSQGILLYYVGRDVY